MRTEEPHVNNSAPEQKAPTPSELLSTIWPMLDEHLGWLCRSTQT